MPGKIVKSLCSFCHTNCGIKVYIDNGKVERIVGDPDHPANRGHLCPKAAAIKRMLDSDERLKHPLIKTNGRFVSITWDEALNFAAEKLDQIRNKYGPESLFHCTGAPTTYFARDGFTQFIGVYGSPNSTGAANLCHVPRAVAFNDAFGGRTEPDFENSRLIIFWASNPINSTRFTAYASCNGFNKIIPRAKERGAKIIAINPVEAEIVDVADEWISPNIGTDTAMGLAMAHTIISEGIYNAAFVNKWLLRFEDIKKHVSLFPPEWAEKITGVPAYRIKELARQYATTEGAAIVDGNGIDMQSNGVDMARTICLLIALTGNIDKPGGNVFMPWINQNLVPTVKPEKKQLGLEQFPLFPSVPFPAFKEALLREEENRPRAVIAHHVNPVLTQANHNRTKKALEKLDFLMVLEIFPTATSEIADLVLPIAAPLEALDYRCYSSTEGGYVALREKIAEPPGEARAIFEIEYDLAKRMGFDGDYPFRNSEEWLEFALEPAKVTLEDLRSDHIVYCSPPIDYVKYEDVGFNTRSGKVECCSDKFNSAHRGFLPVFEPPNESTGTHPDLVKKYSLTGTTRRPAEYLHTKLQNLPTRGRHYHDPLININPADAKKRGIQKGDMVEIESARGIINVKAQVTRRVRPGLVTIDFGWGNPTDNKASLNLLTADDVWDPVSGGYPNRLFLCEVRKTS